MRGEVWNKTPKKEMDNPSVLWRHMADFLRHFEKLRSLNVWYFQFCIFFIKYPSIHPWIRSLLEISVSNGKHFIIYYWLVTTAVEFFFIAANLLYNSLFLSVDGMSASLSVCSMTEPQLFLVVWKIKGGFPQADLSSTEPHYL